jgi:glycosyltransferase involved in cell wall biosynthesis
MPEPALDALAPPARIRAELGIPCSAPLLTCAARLEQEKDIGSLIAAMEHVAVECPSAVCVIAGEGSHKPELLAQIRRSGLEGRVRLLGYRSDVMAILNASDLFVLPSLTESFGLVLLEAMALGKPVLATRVGGPVEIVVEGETGLLVPPSDPGALGRAMLALLRDPATGAEMGRNGRERFRERYTVERMARATRAVYEGVLAAPLPAEVTWTRSPA